MGKFVGQVVKVETDRWPNGQFAQIIDLDVSKATAERHGVLASEDYAAELVLIDGSKVVLGASEFRTLDSDEHDASFEIPEVRQMHVESRALSLPRGNMRQRMNVARTSIAREFEELHRW